MRAFLAPALALLLSAAPGTAWGAGKTVSIELSNADVRDAIRVVAEASRLNFVVDEGVTGRLTLKLRNVKWEDALAVILRARDLGQERSGNVVRIAPLKKLAEEKEAAARLAKADLESRPLKTRIIPVNYAKADEMAAQIKATLSPRGTVTVDRRTNTLIVRDVE